MLNCPSRHFSNTTAVGFAFDSISGVLGSFPDSEERYKHQIQKMVDPVVSYHSPNHAPAVGDKPDKIHWDQIITKA